MERFFYKILDAKIMRFTNNWVFPVTKKVMRLFISLHGNLRDEIIIGATDAENQFSPSADRKMKTFFFFLAIILSITENMMPITQNDSQLTN